MKTPEQVAQEILNALDLGGVSGEGEPTDCYQLTAALRSGWFDGFDAVEWMVRAIEADRVQWQTPVTTHDSRCTLGPDHEGPCNVKEWRG